METRWSGIKTPTLLRSLYSLEKLIEWKLEGVFDRLNDKITALYSLEKLIEWKRPDKITISQSKRLSTR